MLIKDFEFTLKDGRTAIIRSPRDEDIQGTLDYLYKSAGETEFILRYPEECVKYTAEAEKALFERMNESDNETMLVCIVDGIIVMILVYLVQASCNIRTTVPQLSGQWFY